MNIYAAIQLIGVQNCNDLTKNWILGLGGRLEEKACEPKPKNGLAWLGLGLARAVSNGGRDEENEKIYKTETEIAATKTF